MVTVSQILESMIENSPQELNYERLTVFDSYDIPNISIQDYLLRIMQYSRATSRNIVMALSFIDQLSNDDEWPVTLTRHNVHRLLFISIMIASKFYEDFYIDNYSWSRIAGVPLDEVNKLERKFLAYINFGINTKIEHFLNYVQLLLSYAVENGILDRETAEAILQSIVDASVEETRGLDQDEEEKE